MWRKGTEMRVISKGDICSGRSGSGVVRSAFSLIEVVVALAMLALIAVPAVGLATMAVSQSKDQLTTGFASELKGRLDNALRASDFVDVFDKNYISADSSAVFWASRDLVFIEPEGAITTDSNDKYYKVILKKPKDYSYRGEDRYRIVVYEVTWPENISEPSRNQLFFTSVFRNEF